jgi:hypothetical protein
MPEAQIKFRYFSPAAGHVVSRPGTGSQIGATRGPSGFVVNPDMVVPIPVSEIQRFAKEYSDALRNKELVERTQDDFDKQQAEVEAEEKRDQAERDAAREKETVQAAPVPLDPRNTDRPLRPEDLRRSGNEDD